MTFTLILFASAVALELLVHLLGKVRRLRRILAMVAICTGGFVAGMLLAMQPNTFTGLVVLISMYRLFNMVRVIQERMHEQYLRRATRTTTLSLLVVQGLIFAAWWAWQTWHTDGFTSWGIIAGMQFVTATILLLSVLRNLHKTRWTFSKSHYSDHELPTVSVAIPARNETEDLQTVLQQLIASDYPKLEIIVLDDCSQIKRTPEIIKQFAHDGVRFIQGSEPSETWLPKNQAYNRLTSEASGAYILFCGVDTRFEPQTIRQLITVMLDRKKQMLCVLPERQGQAASRSSLIQAMRYWWELVPPRRLFRRPPVISSCWVIQQTALKAGGGFAAVARSIMPEAHFAKRLIADDGYSFLRSTENLGVSSVKQIHDQRDTAIRMRYPQLHRRPEQVALLTLAELGFLSLPFALAIAAFWVEIGRFAHLTAILTSLLLVLTYELSVLSTKVNSWSFGLVGQPLAALMDIALLHYSMWKYEFSTVDWKGRNVCIPVMHVIPHLPVIDKHGQAPPHRG